MAIFEQDEYFKYGLENAIKDSFVKANADVEFTGVDMADIVIVSPGKQFSIEFCHTQVLLRNPYYTPIYITILPSNLNADNIRCKLVSGVFIRTESVSEITEKIIYLYAEKRGGANCYCPKCYSKLTFCEGRICRLTFLGYSQNQISELLNISQKTVSSHKRSAMNKLSIDSNLGLLRWIKKHSYM
ncbi:LuxR C-terminal-related transcriptional regulator [Serratia ureilytica]|uniref:LuxR C-terminal-related transcriptional regulator n=1 Tax=Serratia ureilytica TaxID=300181 RepID=UPI00326659F5